MENPNTTPSQEKADLRGSKQSGVSAKEPFTDQRVDVTLAIEEDSQLMKHYLDSLILLSDENEIY